MKTTKEQIEEFTTLDQIAGRIRRDRNFLQTLLDETEERQPILFSGMMYFGEKLDPKAATEVVTLYLVVWAAYRQYPECKTTALTQDQFSQLQKKTFEMFNFLDGEDDTSLFELIARDDFERRQVPTLPGFIHHCFTEWPALKAMDLKNSALIHLSLKGFIDCFEEVSSKQLSVIGNQ